MDLVKEIKELFAAIKDALTDGKITPAEALKIAKELIDVLSILLTNVATQTEKQEDK
jgi:uncharacterized FlaG/YvyC family protein